MNLIQRIINAFLNIFRKWWSSRTQKQLIEFLEREVPDDKADEMAEEFLELLLKLMSLTYKIDSDFRKNIEGFQATYQFRSQDTTPGKCIAVLATFDGNNMKVKELKTPLPDEEVTISIIFKNGKAIINYLLVEGGDILQPVLNNEVILRGNVNYMLKFGYMANHVQLALSGKLP